MPLTEPATLKAGATLLGYSVLVNLPALQMKLRQYFRL
jgi:hypothetical protein